MTGGDWFPIGLGVLIALWILKCIYMRYYGATGQHHDYWIEWGGHIPHGTVWFNSKTGEWMTQPRQDWAKPRRFSARSNPLDHDYRWETREVPSKTVKVPFEVEY